MRRVPPKFCVGRIHAQFLLVESSIPRFNIIIFKDMVLLASMPSEPWGPSDMTERSALACHASSQKRGRFLITPLEFTRWLVER